MPVFRPWKSDSHFTESNLSSSNFVISASAGIVPQSTRTQNEQFPVSFFFWPTVLASLSDVSQIEIRPKGQSCYRPPAALPMAASENTEKERHKLFLRTASRREMWWNLLSSISELAFINCLDSQRQDTDGGFERNDVMSAFLFSIFWPCLLLG